MIMPFPGSLNDQDPADVSCPSLPEINEIPCTGKMLYRDNLTIPMIEKKDWKNKDYRYMRLRDR